MIKLVTTKEPKVQKLKYTYEVRLYSSQEEFNIAFVKQRAGVPEDANHTRMVNDDDSLARHSWEWWEVTIEDQP